jgi:hypothetical protein
MTDPKSQYDEILAKDAKRVKLVVRPLVALIVNPALTASLLWLIFFPFAFWKCFVIAFILHSLFYSVKPDQQS